VILFYTHNCRGILVCLARAITVVIWESTPPVQNFYTIATNAPNSMDEPDSMDEPALDTLLAIHSRFSSTQSFSH